MAGTVTMKEFFYHLHDTIILLGGGTNIAKMVENSESLTQSDVESLKAYNCRLITLAKDRVANIHRMQIRTDK